MMDEPLHRHNPWWKSRLLIEEDEDIVKWKASIHWVPSLIDEVVLEPFSLNFVFGPRQVGKTTLVKLLIKRLLEDDVDPWRIFYFRCDMLSNHRELDHVLNAYLELRDAHGVDSSFIFLDEVTFPREWYRAVKYHLDLGDFENDVLTLTGSLSMVAKGEIETFPGRRGKGRNYVLLPVSFREFVKIFQPKVFNELPLIESLDANEIMDKTEAALPYLRELNALFRRYLICGGFPLAIRSIHERGKITQDVKDTYLNWLRGDLFKMGRNPETAREIIKLILEKAPSPVSWHGLAKETELKSHKTVHQYIHTLSELFIVKVLYHIDPNTLHINFAKNKKVHLMDPFLYQVLSEWCLLPSPNESVVVKATVATHLARKYEVSYWKNRWEIDVVARDEKHAIGFEVKWREKPRKTSAKTGKISHIITLTKNHFNRSKLMTPVSLFLACI